jgi:hypothetical protein
MVLFLIIKKFFAFGFSGAITLAIVGTLVIGYQWSELNKTPWSNDRVGIEQVYYGMEVDKRIAEGESRNYLTRPERTGPEFPIPYQSALVNHMWSVSEVNNTFSVGGYVPIKGIPRYESMIDIALYQFGMPYFELLALPQAGWIVSERKINLDSINCIVASDCIINNSIVKPESWSIDKLKFTISSSKSGNLVINEIPWEGWTAKVCSDSDCVVYVTDFDEKTLLLNVPITSSTISVTFEYVQPLKLISWTIFVLALLLMLIIIYALSKRNVKNLEY